MAAGPCAAVRPEPQPADRPDVLLELGRRGALDRPVARVVDAWRQLVDDQRLVGHQEQLHGQGALEVHRRRERGPDRGRVLRHPGRSRGGHARSGEDAGVMHVPPDREGRDLVAGSRDDHRELHREGELALGEQDDTGLNAEALPGTVELVRGGDPDLAPAVIAAGRQLETERQAQLSPPPPALP